MVELNSDVIDIRELADSELDYVAGGWFEPFHWFIPRL
jgi:hypothetical protein